MHLSISCGKGLDKLSAELRALIESKIDDLDRFDARITNAHVIINKHAHKSTKGQEYTAKCNMHLPHQIISAVGKSRDALSAIDLLVNKLARQIRKRKTKLGAYSLSKTRRELAKFEYADY